MARAWFLGLLWLPLATQQRYEPLAPLTRETILLGRIKSVAGANLARAPNYTCTMTIDRWRQEAQQKRMYRQDRLRLEVALAGGRELFALPGAPKFEEREITDLVPGGAIGTGDFSAHAHSVMLGRNVRYNYAGRQERDGRTLEQFHFVVDRTVSTYTMKIGPMEGLVGYAGDFWVDAATLDLARIELDITEIPPGMLLQGGHKRIDYERVKIGDSDFLLPKLAEITLRGLTGAVSRNVTEFSGCRQYTGESVLTFEDVESKLLAEQPVAAPAALPAGVVLRLKLTAAVPLRAAATGDPFEAVLEADARAQGQVVLAKGARVRGRVTGTASGDQPRGWTLVGLRLETFHANGGSGAVEARLERPNEAGAAFSNVERDQTWRRALWSARREMGRNLMLVYGARKELPSGLAMTWITLEKLGGPRP